jgi:ADP-ribose diphosphatase
MIKRTGERVIFNKNLFKIKDIDIETDLGKKATYQIMEKADTALIVPIDSENNLILVREYFYAIDEYQLGLPKGRIDEGSNALKTANKELQEEVGFKANKLDKLGVLTMTPGYSTQRTHAFLARELSESKLRGDELEELEIVKRSFAKFEELIESGDLTEARAIAALYLAKSFLAKSVRA